MPRSLYWTTKEVPAELDRALRILAQEYPVREGAGETKLVFRHDLDPGNCRVSRASDELMISYGATSDALRGLGAALAGLPEQGRRLSEQCPFKTLGIMLDCSRNAVMTVDHVKRWLRRLALLGYNMMMLYTEDTYQMEGEPFFGLFRGAYSEEELKEIDGYAADLGIELIGCIQTLGHLEQMLKWGAYDNVKDTDRELLVGEPATYALVRKMIASISRCLRSRRIHVGMDETWTLGRGRFLDRNGLKSGHEILTRHVAEVIGICDELGMRPMIWSDMYFRYAGDMHADYQIGRAIPDEVKAAIPRNLELVYWDYYSDAEQHYLDRIAGHRALGREPIMGSGIWTWLHLWYGRAATEAFAAPCVRACRQAGLSEIFLTMWGDDGAYCEFDSALAGIAFAAGLCYGEDEASLKRRFESVCGVGYDQVLLGSALEFPAEGAGAWTGDAVAAATLWDDPLIGMHSLSVSARHPEHWPQAAAHYRALAAALAAHRESAEPVDFGYAAALANLLAAKIEFRLRLEQAYRARNRGQLESLLGEVPDLVALTEGFEETFRRQWLRRNKPYGLETVQIRLGGLRQRYLEIGRALRELLDGERAGIPELDEGLSLSRETLARLHAGYRYRRLAAPGIL